MCLILFAYRMLPGHPLIVAANRDEFYARPAAGAHWWPDAAGLLAGRDEEAGGTWLGVQADGRFAAVTNFTDPQADPGARSRGELAVRFLRDGRAAAAYAAELRGDEYQGFNLLLWDGGELICTSNRGATRVLAPGCYGLTNAALGAPWPKAVAGAARLKCAIHDDLNPEKLIKLLQHDRPPEPGQQDAPGTEESRGAPCFIRGEAYGTRASTVVIHAGASVVMAEQTYGPDGRVGARQDFSFAVQPLSGKGKHGQTG